MAKRTATRAVQVYRAPPAQSSSPVIRISTPKPAKAPRRRSSGGAGGAQSHQKNLVGVIVGAGLIGMLKKSGTLDKIPSLPVVGRIGALAIGAHFWAKNGGGALARDVSLAAGAIAAYQMGSNGSIDGEDDEDAL